MKSNKCNKIILVASLSLLGAECFWASSVYASGFNIPVKSISDLGNEFAGGAALANDASTNYYNPAGIVRIDHPELIGGLTYVFSSAQFKGTTTAPSPWPFTPPYQGTGIADTYQSGYLPTLHFVSPLFSEQVFFGFSLTTPAGLGSDYGNNSILRYATVKATADVINLGPSLAFKITDKLSIGAGPDFQHFKAKFNNKVYIMPTLSDSKVEVNTSSWGYGWHAGLLYQFTPNTRVGLNYISKIVQDMNGVSSFSMQEPFPMKLSTSNVKLGLVLPPSTLLSIYHDLNDKWAVMSTIGYTQWNVFRSVTMDNVASPNGYIHVVMPESFHNTWSFAAAVNYKVNEQWLLRAGAGTDETASDDTCRDTITPDSTIFATNIGFHFQQNKVIGWDAAYSHSFMRSININHFNPANGTTETGIYRRQGNVIGLQMNLNLDSLFHRNTLVSNKTT